MIALHLGNGWKIIFVKCSMAAFHNVCICFLFLLQQITTKLMALKKCTFTLLRVLQFRSLKSVSCGQNQGVSRALLLSAGSRGETVFLTFLPFRPVFLAFLGSWLLSSLKSAIWHLASVVTLLPSVSNLALPPSYKNTTQIIQENLSPDPWLNHIAKSFFKYKVTFTVSRSWNLDIFRAIINQFSSVQSLSRVWLLQRDRYWDYLNYHP